MTKYMSLADLKRLIQYARLNGGRFVDDETGKEIKFRHVALIILKKNKKRYETVIPLNKMYWMSNKELYIHEDGRLHAREIPQSILSSFNNDLSDVYNRRIVFSINP